VLVAIALPPAARLIAGPPGADIQVEWKASVDEAGRAAAAAGHHLANPRKLQDTYTWRYELTDTSTATIRALVNDPAIEDTQEIERQTYTLEPTAPRTSRQQHFKVGGDAIVGAADGLAALFLVLALLISVTHTAPLQLVQRAIPEVDAATAGLFRIVFGAAALAFFWSHRVDASWLSATFDLEIQGGVHTAVMGWLRAHPAIVNLVTPWLLTMGTAFTVGVFTRLTYALFVAGALVWAYVAMSLSSTHPYSPFVLTLVALLPSRWGDALSVDAWLTRRVARGFTPRLADRKGPPYDSQSDSKLYGYSVWVPALAFGVAFAAAAWTKLTVPPGLTDWVLNGTVKYHFVTDSVNAPVTWGLQLAKHPTLAILASFAAIVTEALVLTAAFSRNEWYRLAVGAGAMALLAGFRLFMGVFWPGWWILLLGFLPWRRLGCAFEVRLKPDTTYARPGLRGATVLQLALVAFVIGQQFVVTSLKLERAPMFSWYDMYSRTYSSPAEWSASRDPLYHIVASTDRGPVPLSACKPHGEFIAEFQSALKGSREASRSVWLELSNCGADISGAREVTLEGDVQAFDWNTLVFTTTPKAVRLGPLAADDTAPAARTR
jgi:hypothetical protein